MTTQDTVTLIKLSDTGQTVSDATDDIRGRKVKDKDGNDLGKVDDLLIDDRERKVRFLRVEHGGFLGFGETKSFIPVDAITEITDDDVHVNHSRDHISHAPRYDPELVDAKTYYGNVYEYYGYLPFWGVGYNYPGYSGLDHSPGTPPSTQAARKDIRQGRRCDGDEP